MTTAAAPSAQGPWLARARSFLFVPADRLERLPKALASGADAVIVDLEDAVAPAAKAGARLALASAWGGLDAPQRARLVLRVNAASTTWHEDDLALLAQLPGLAGVMLAKAESAVPLQRLAERQPGLGLLPLIESADGLLNLSAIAAAPQVLRLALGHIDLQADLGMACSPDEHELLPARWQLVLVSRGARLAPPVDGVTVALDQPGLTEADTLRSRRLGFGAKLCIHPNQVAAVHRALAPSEAERAWAQRVLAAAEAAGDGPGAGALRVDGRMVDAPVLALARRWLSASEPV
ncbi:CoA ester lyase [Curvibacter sp. HBC61]|uniref:CoA ester lyase n=1 Tax=Curvibacter cyanobacteriorum TaxID=3026422 RepID=A0ABT5MUH8_9BURK|nr:CoA ester lyase [Curvibacter sp. HBC61]MDD0837708.1 CoA ester lyase [Curvibacter sp. HBC61]